MSILSGVASALAGRGSGYSKFPAGTHLVRLAEVQIRTEWTEGKPITWDWGNGQVVAAVGIEPRYVIITDGEPTDAKAQSIETIVVPLSAPPPELAADIAAADAYQKGAASIAYRFSIGRRSLNSFLNVAMGQDPNAMVESPDAYLEAITAAAGPDGPVFQVSVAYEARKNDPSKTNTRVNYLLAS